MALNVDQLAAGNILRESYERVYKKPQTSCAIAGTVGVVMNGKGCLTYQYILLTALVAKLTNPQIDMLSLQVEDESDGAYAARTLCKDVIYPFQKQILFNALDGSNADPLVNNPARYPRLSKLNAARGDGRVALEHLCDSLPALSAVSEIQETLDYMMSGLIMIAKKNKEKKDAVNTSVRNADFGELYSFLSELIDQNFGGSALVLAAYALFLIHFPPAQGYKIIPHPVNQSGASSRQRSDLDIELNGRPFLGVELKDKPFTSDDVERASEAALLGGLGSLLFISGRHAGSASAPTYFSSVKKKYASRGFAVGVIGIDELMDLILVSHHDDINASQILSDVYDCVSIIGGTAETQTWIYSRFRSLG